MADLDLDVRSAALVLIDLQKGIVARQTAPYSSSEVVQRAAQLADAFRKSASTVVLVHVVFSADDRDRLNPRVDSPQPSSGPMPPDYGEIVKELGPEQNDIIVTKRQWGAFYGTDLDLQLRRRRVNTIVIGGIATNFGVESTARAAWEHAYQVVFVEDAMAGLSADAHQFAVKNIFPRLGMVRSTEQVLAAMSSRA